MQLAQQSKLQVICASIHVSTCICICTQQHCLYYGSVGHLYAQPVCFVMLLHRVKTHTYPSQLEDNMILMDMQLLTHASTKV